MSWLDGWSYRKKITLNGTSDGDQTDLPVRIKLYKNQDAVRTLLTSCEDVSNWSGESGVSKTTKKEGIGAIYHSGTTWSTSWTGTAVDSGVSEADGYLHLWFYISDKSKLGSSVAFEISSSGTWDNDEYQWGVSAAELSDGWNELNLKISEANTAGSPVLSAINFFRSYCTSVSSTITKAWDDISFYGGLSTTDPVLDDHANEDYSDLRFTDSDGTTELDYWLDTNYQSPASDEFVHAWVEIPSIGSSDKDIYVYYGKADAIDQSDGASVFSFFDDFGDDLSKWTTSEGDGGSAAISDGKLVLDSSSDGGHAWAYNSSAFSVDSVVEARMSIRSDYVSSNTRIRLIDNHKPHDIGIFNSDWRYYWDGDSGVDATTDAWLRFYGTYTDSSVTWGFNIEDRAVTEDYSNSYSPSDSPTEIDFRCGDGPSSSTSKGLVWVDLVFARPLLSDEPTVSSVAEEEEAPSEGGLIVTSVSGAVVSYISGVAAENISKISGYSG